MTRNSKGPFKLKMTKQPKQTPAQPRPRMSLRNAMRFHGLDEHKITSVLRRQVNRLQRLISKEKLDAAQEKLFLEVLKECIKIMEPAARANVMQEPGGVQLVHDVPRPPRDPVTRDGPLS